MDKAAPFSAVAPAAARHQNQWCPALKPRKTERLAATRRSPITCPAWLSSCRAMKNKAPPPRKTPTTISAISAFPAKANMHLLRDLQAELLQDRRAMFVQLRRGGTCLGIFVRGELYRGSLHADRAEIGVERLDDHVALDDLRIGHHLRHIVERTRRHAGFVEQRKTVL